MFLFPPEQQNRRLTSWEIQEDREIAKLFGRPHKYFLLDKPFYWDLIPEPIVNFKLNFQDK